MVIRAQHRIGEPFFFLLGSTDGRRSVTVVYLYTTHHAPPERVGVAGKIVPRLAVLADRVFFGEVDEIAAKY